MGVLRLTRVRKTERRVRKGGKETNQLCSHVAIFRQAVPNTVPGNLLLEGGRERNLPAGSLSHPFSCW